MRRALHHRGIVVFIAAVLAGVPVLAAGAPPPSVSASAGANPVEGFSPRVGDPRAPGAPNPPDGALPAEPSVRVIEGWTVQVAARLWEEDRAATTVALALLERQLAEIVRVVPAPALARLREVCLWLSPPYPDAGPTAEYHPSEAWLREHGRNPAMAQGVEFTNIRQFQSEMNRMPNFVLHELAHAYHDRVLGFDHPGIQAAFERARKEGRYEQVERHFGNGRPSRLERAYAMTNAREYFAESTEAFFARNDFFPFTRSELEQHDPGVVRLLERLWNPASP